MKTEELKSKYSELSVMNATVCFVIYEKFKNNIKKQKTKILIIYFLPFGHGTMP